MSSKKKYLKKRTNIKCFCAKKQPPKDKIKYGTCKCDVIDMRVTLNKVISNYLYQYIYEAKKRICREDGGNEKAGISVG